MVAAVISDKKELFLANALLMRIYDRVIDKLFLDMNTI